MKTSYSFLIALIALVGFGCAHKEPQVVDVTGLLAAARTSNIQPVALAPAAVPVAAVQPVVQKPLPKSAYVK